MQKIDNLYLVMTLINHYLSSQHKCTYLTNLFCIRKLLFLNGAKKDRKQWCRVMERGLDLAFKSQV